MYVSPPIDPNPIAQALVDSGPTIGLPMVEDNNAGDMEGTSFFNMTVKDGKRNSVANAYLRPAMSRSNLTVLTNAETNRLVLEGSKCVGVEYQKDGKTEVARANSEVILSGGVFGSPRALIMSGIGREEDLKALGIDVVLNSRGVGQNLQDHVLSAGINYECKIPLPPLSNNGAESTMWWKSRPEMSVPDIQPVILEFPFASPELADRLPNDNCYAIAPSVVRVASRGTFKLASANPADTPLIDTNFMSRDSDINAMLAAIDLCRELGASDAFSELRKIEVMPGKLSREDMIQFIRNSATTYFHPTSTCKMGVGDDAVVDPELRVYGIDNLRIADASIMPTITTGNTNAPSVMIGEKCAELLSKNADAN